MPRILLPIMGTVLLCAQALNAWAVEATATTAGTTAYEQVREQIESKREQLAGVKQVGKATPANVLNAPVDTDDAPSQEQQP